MAQDDFSKRETSERDRLRAILDFSPSSKTPGKMVRQWNQRRADALREIELLDLWRSIQERGENPAEVIPRHRWPRILMDGAATGSAAT